MDDWQDISTAPKDGGELHLTFKPASDIETIGSWGILNCRSWFCRRKFAWLTLLKQELIPQPTHWRPK